MNVIISNILAIYRKELQGYFAAPLAYIVASFFWLIGGFFLWWILFSPDSIIQKVAFIDLHSQQGTPLPIDVPYEFLQSYLGVMGSLALFILPMLSMGLYSEERKRGTLELLATSPITNWAVALGKLLGVLTFFTTMMVPLMACEAIALSASKPPIQPFIPILANGGLLLLAAAVLSLGMFISSLTDSSFVAAFLTFVLILILWLIDLVSTGIGGPVGEALGYLSLLKHYQNFVKGVLDSSSVILFASYIFLGVFLTAQSIDTFRFHRS